MREEELNKKEEQNSPEDVEGRSEKDLQEVLECIEINSEKEEEILNEIKDNIKEDSDAQEKGTEDGIISLLSKKIKKNKLIRTALVGFMLYSASPAVASEEKNIPREPLSLSATELSQRESFNPVEKLSQASSIPDVNKEEVEQVYNRAPKEIKRVIADELNKKDKTINDKNDASRLVLQQQIIDLQNKGEMALRREGGVVLPHDEEHSGESDGIEYTNEMIAEDGGRQRITIENASEEEVRAWINYLKNQKNKKQ